MAEQPLLLIPEQLCLKPAILAVHDLFSLDLQGTEGLHDILLGCQERHKYLT
jgi:hypothetical protein